MVKYAHILYRMVSRKTGKMCSFATCFRSWPISSSRSPIVVFGADMVPELVADLSLSA